MERFRLAAAAVNCLIYEVDLTTGRALRSEALFALTGYHPDEAEPTSQWWEQRVHPEDLPRCFERFAQVLANPGQGPLEQEYRIRHKDGHYVHVWDHVVILRDDSGQPVRVVGGTFDVTPRRRAEEALRESEERHRIISELTSDYNYVLRLDADGTSRLELVTEGFTRLLGYTLEEVDGPFGWQVLVHPDDLPLMHQVGERVLAGQEGACIVRLITKEGNLRWVRSLNKPAWGPTPGVVSRIIGAAQDITEWKNAEDALRESEERFQAFMDNGPALAWMKDEQFRYAYRNKKHAEFFREKLEERLGRTGFEVWPHVAEQLRQNDLAVLESGAVLELTESVPDADGRLRHFLVYKFPFTDRTGKRYVGGIAIDVSDRKQAEEELRQSRERLQVLSRQLITVQESERRRIAYELHDQIGQTLTVIRFHLHAVKTTPRSARSALDDAIAIADQAIQQVRHLSLDLRPSLLDDLGLEATLRWYSHRQMQRTGVLIHLETDLAGSRLPAELETTCFRVVQEAMTNVARHARAQQVWIELRLCEQALELVIRDDGAGFDTSVVRQRAAEETSFGLIGMQERVELLGGVLILESQPGQGTCIRARLPLPPPSPCGRGVGGNEDTAKDTSP